jgi:hypothetical protein
MPFSCESRVAHKLESFEFWVFFSHLLLNSQHLEQCLVFSECSINVCQMNKYVTVVCLPGAPCGSIASWFCLQHGDLTSPIGTLSVTISATWTNKESTLFTISHQEQQKPKRKVVVAKNKCRHFSLKLSKRKTKQGKKQRWTVLPPEQRLGWSQRALETFWFCSKEERNKGHHRGKRKRRPLLSRASHLRSSARPPAIRGHHFSF